VDEGPEARKSPRKPQPWNRKSTFREKASPKEKPLKGGGLGEGKAGYQEGENLPEYEERRGLGKL